jgi:hypothetical protein
MRLINDLFGSQQGFVPALMLKLLWCKWSVHELYVVKISISRSQLRGMETPATKRSVSYAAPFMGSTTKFLL